MRHPTTPIPPRADRAIARSVAVGIAAALALVSLACATPTSNDTRSATAGLPNVEQSLMANEWVLDPDQSSLSSAHLSEVTLSFSAEQLLAGSAPCNTYRGTFSLDGSSIAISDLAQTQIACDQPVMDAEREYLEALAAITTVDTRQRDRLVLEGDGGLQLSFVAVDVYTSLLGTWSIVNLARGDALVTPVNGTDPTMTFTSAGELQVDTGCNPMGSSWALEGRHITIEPPRQTLMACSTPPGVMEQETAIGVALEAADRVDIAGDTLTLVNAEGMKTIVARAR